MTDVPGRYSRYLLGEEFKTLDGERTLLPPEPVKRLGLSDDLEIQASELDTFFRMASREYRGAGSASLWWVIADYQESYHHPLAPLEMGESIVVPSLRTVQEIIMSEDRREVPPQMLAALRAEEEGI